MLKELFNNLNLGTVVLTPNRRLAIYLQRSFDLLQQNSGKKAWLNIKILPITTWVESLFQYNEILLNKHQEYFIWQQIITAYANKNPLINIAATIEQVQQAYELLRQWQLDIKHPLFTATQDAQIFKQWVNQFTSKCKSNNWLSRSDIIDKVMYNISNNELALPQHLILVAFDQISPQTKQLLHHIKIKKCRVEHFDPNNQTSQQGHVSIPDTEQELISMALWANKCAAEYPQASIGCIVPDLAKTRPQVEYIFNKINSSNFDMSIGKKLSEFLIKSPRSLKSSQPPFDKEGLPSPPLLKGAGGILEAGGIQQLSQAFNSLKLVINKPTSADLETLAARIIFQPQAAQPTPIKILGTLEAAGLNFDYLWIMGLTNKNWPPSPSSNPFIPIQLQRQFNMPHASAERELQFCRLLTKRFARSAANIIYSHAAQHQDQPLMLSPLIKNIPEIKLVELNLPKFTLYDTQPAIMETLYDMQAPTLESNKPTPGGSKIFQLQAMCPFRAFAECRLGAKELESQQLGLDARQRGIIVHSALEYVWKAIGDSEQLCAYTDHELKAIINECVSNGLTTINSPLVSLEQKRLQKLLWDWLMLEKTRIPFKVIAQEQESIATIGKLNSISIRIDRIDQLQDNSLLILDYKTGKTSTKGWYDDRLEEPQLPLYCVTNPKPISGIILAQVKNGSLKFNGITQQDKQIPKVKTVPDWKELIATWRSSLTKLANDFSNGNAAVDPKDGNKTCRYCKLRCLCRFSLVRIEDLRI